MQFNFDGQKNCSLIDFLKPHLKQHGLVELNLIQKGETQSLLSTQCHVNKMYSILPWFPM